ncbi:hypothetical protein CYLTODRAFT_416196 [Cylindrobasidium torrendii FP15055 ss-10]|uniref:Mmc1 C-terminal domain-containing protein n=1 Tax=Cylindrobasidium torrendii FP15055 ss-10 TaxID=1314674 RepID=A0A0D7BW00_9AGAR|nr:hypothetical protein CYLTODRAFT_416196 [Cylindrobasidium torrendii FP15055 ss-10]
MSRTARFGTLLRGRLRICTAQLHTAPTASSAQRTKELLPRILPPPSDTCPPEQSIDIWNRVLDAPSAPAVTVSVLSSDQWSNSHQLVTAFLREPFASDASNIDRVAARWNNKRTQSLVIKPSPDAAPSTFPCSSSYLRQFSAPIQIEEFLTSNIRHASTLEGYLRADIPLILINPLTASIADIFHLRSIFQNPNTLYVITHASSSPTDSLSLRERYGAAFEGLNILFADPHLAIYALDILKADPNSPTAVQAYQDAFVQSGISTISSAIRRIIETTKKTAPSEIVEELQEEKRLAQLRMLKAILKGHQAELDAQAVTVSRLQARTAEERVRTYADIFDKETSAHIQHQAGKEIKDALVRLSWWRMVGHVDEITSVVSAIVARSMGRLEKQLVYNSGRLSHVQQEYARKTLKVLPPPGSLLHSAVLENELAQLMQSPHYALGPSTFLEPLMARESQINQYPTTRLHIAGQRSVIGCGISSVAGVAMGWVGWMDWLGSATSLGLEAQTMFGVGGLVSVLGLRWAVGHWEKAKKRWWADYSRVYEGLERDLKRTTEQVLAKNVLLVPSQGCANMTERIEKRNREIEELADEVTALEGINSPGSS